MTFKFDGIDGCGKSTLIKNVYKVLSKTNRVCVMKEFGNKRDISFENLKQKISISFLLRQMVTTDKYCLDDIEREMLWSVMSRRTNRLIIPKLLSRYDLLLVDRSELGNYAYGLAINKKLKKIYDSALDDLHLNDTIFWVDTPIEVCMERVHKRTKHLSYNEKKGTKFLKIVHDNFEKLSTKNKNVIRLDGTKDIDELIIEILNIINIYKLTVN
jgi:thymidylate kinase